MSLVALLLDPENPRVPVLLELCDFLSCFLDEDEAVTFLCLWVPVDLPDVGCGVDSTLSDG